jgi:hypothetical protein
VTSSYGEIRLCRGGEETSGFTRQEGVNGLIPLPLDCVLAAARCSFRDEEEPEEVGTSGTPRVDGRTRRGAGHRVPMPEVRNGKLLGRSGRKMS